MALKKKLQMRGVSKGWIGFGIGANGWIFIDHSIHTETPLHLDSRGHGTEDLWL